MPLITNAAKTGYDTHVGNTSGNPHGTTATMVGAYAAGAPLALPDLAAPAAPASGLVLQGFNQQGFSVPHVYDAQGNAIEITRDNLVIVRNTSGAGMTKGQPVRVTGASGVVPTVGLAKADSPATLPAIGILYEDVANNAYGRMLVIGTLEKVNLSAFANGALLYVSDTVAGGLTATPPKFAQSIGTVLDNAVQGVLQVFTRVVQRRANSVSLEARDALIAVTSGAGALVAVETATNKVNYQALPFVNGSKTYVSWQFVAPSDWDGAAMQFMPIWLTSSASAANVVWGAQLLCLTDGTAIDSAFGAAVEITDANLGANIVSHPPAPATGLTPGGGAPSGGQQLILRLYRLGTGADTLAATANLLGVHLLYTRS